MNNRFYSCTFKKAPYNHKIYRNSTKIARVETRHVLTVTFGAVVEDQYFSATFTSTLTNYEWFYSEMIANAVAKNTQKIVTLREIGYKNRFVVIWKN